MRRSLWTSIVLTVALCGCSDPPTKESNNGGANNGATNNGATNNGGTNNGGGNNGGECGARWCPGDCIENGDGWCAVNSFGGAYNVAMWVHAPDEIWLAEQSGNVRVGSGTTWEEHPVPGIDQISDIIGTGSGQVWVSTYPTGVYRWDGGAWVEETMIDPPAESGLGRFAYDDVTDTLFLAGQAAIYQRVGQQWEPYTWIEGGELQNVTNCGGTRWFAAGYPMTVDDSGFASLWGTAAANRVTTATVIADDVVLGGGSSRVIFNDGAFKTIGATFLNDLSSVTGTSPKDLWASVPRSNATEIWHYDGRAWSLIKEYDNQHDVGSLFTDTEGIVRVTFEYGVSEVIDMSGAVISNAGWPRTPNNFEEYAAYHVSMDEYWVGVGGMYRWTADGGWETNLPGPSRPLAFWGNRYDDVWFLNANAEIVHSDGVDDRNVNPGVELSPDLNAITGSETGHVWVAGGDQVLQFDGADWTEHVGFDAGAEPGGGNVALAAIGDEAWVFRGSDVFHWDGAAWEYIAPQQGVFQVGCDNGELVAMGNYPPAMLRGAPDRMTRHGALAQEYSASRGWITSEADAWLITHDLPFVHRWTGDEFVDSVDNAEVLLLDIQALPSGEAYLMGTNALFVRRP